MIVGFTIDDFRGHEKEAVEYISKVCVLDDPRIAQNIVAAGAGVNVFSSAVTLSGLNAQPFKATPIETRDGKYLLVSAVNFNIELLYNDSILRLVPTEYRYIDTSEVAQFFGYVKQGIVKIIPEIAQDQKSIFDEGIWNDDGVWVDSDCWRD